ncbi:MAG: hypothetical protein IJ778_03000, partial [Alphaproteobacteria bacterium]|nr:hypothetical protein [Alphaproteobacteria bacterium]
MNKLKKILCLCILITAIHIFVGSLSAVYAQQLLPEKKIEFYDWSRKKNQAQAPSSADAKTSSSPKTPVKIAQKPQYISGRNEKGQEVSVNPNVKNYQVLGLSVDVNTKALGEAAKIAAVGAATGAAVGMGVAPGLATAGLAQVITEADVKVTEKENQCANAKPFPAANATDSLHPDAAGLFDNSILTEMQKMLHKLYKTFGLLFMVGHGLLCYATMGDGLLKLASGAWMQIITFLPVPLFIPNWNLLFSGIFIYFFAMILAMAVGLYFVDISFKLGFAVLLLPVSIGLWPFKPTSRKLTENVSIIVRNAMLFTLMSIGLSFCIVLIMESVFSGGVLNWEEFWEALETSNTGKMVESFSLFSMHTLVIVFCIIYGLKILASSIEDYLKYLFNDSIFGSESPIHHLS